jgi:hypothetical protein
MKFLLGIFINICRENSSLVKNRTKISGAFQEDLNTVMVSRRILPKNETKSKYTYHAKYILSTKMSFMRYEK